MIYLLFVGHNYYPQGGADDFVGVAGTLEDAKGLLPEGFDPNLQWAQVAMLHEGKMTKVKEWWPHMDGWEDPEE